MNKLIQNFCVKPKIFVVSNSEILSCSSILFPLSFENKCSSVLQNSVGIPAVSQKIHVRKQQDRFLLNAGQSLDDRVYTLKVVEKSLGTDMMLNLSLHGLGIVPTKAYRNIYVNALLQKTKDIELSKTKAVYVPLTPEKDEMDVSICKEEASDVGQLSSPKISNKPYSRIVNLATNYLEKCGNLFIHDGMVGSDRGNSFKFRAVCDNAATGLLFREFSEKCSFVKDAHKFAYDVSFFVLGNLSEFSDKKPACIINVEKKQIILLGTLSSTAISSAFFEYSKVFFQENPKTIALKADAFNFSNGNVSLIFGSNGNLFSDSLISAHSTVWGEEGVSRMFGGVIVNKENTERGGYNEKMETNIRSIHSGTSQKGNIWNHPNSVFILDKNSSSKISKIEIDNIDVSNFNTDNEKLKLILKEKNVDNIYQLGIKNQNLASIEKIIKSKLTQ